MKGLLKRVAAPVAAAVVLAFVSPAGASSVTYFTEGVFGNHTAVLGSSDLQSDSLSVAGSAGTSTIKYYNSDLSYGAPPTGSGANGSHTVALVGGAGSASEGFFSLSSNAKGAGNSFNGVAFTLDLFQNETTNGKTVPVLISAVSGTLTGTAMASGGTVNLTFVPKNFLIAGTGVNCIYSVNNLPTHLNCGGTSPTTPLDGGVTAVPVPATASVGGAMMIGLALMKGLAVLRKRRLLATV